MQLTNRANLGYRFRYRNVPPAEATYLDCAMSKKEILVVGIVFIVGCVLVVFTAQWRSMDFGKMGFGKGWNCPPNATPASTVCIKKPTAS